MGDTTDGAIWELGRQVKRIADIEERRVEALKLRNRIELLRIVSSHRAAGGSGDYQVWAKHAIKLYNLLEGSK